MNQSEKKEESDNVNSTSKYADDTNSEEVDKNKITSTIETKSKETDDDVGSRENMEETGMEIDDKTPDEIDKTEDESSLSLTKETKIRESDGANSDAINEEANIDNLADDDIEIFSTSDLGIMFVCTLAPSAFATIKALLFSGTIFVGNTPLNTTFTPFRTFLLM
jgi:hypothetical protein